VDLVTRYTVIVLAALAAVFCIAASASAAGVTPPKACKTSPPPPNGLRAMLVSGGYHYLYGCGGVQPAYYAVDGPYRLRVAFKAPTDREALKAAVTIYQHPDQKAMLEASLAKLRHARSATITRARSWGRYLVLDSTAR
jgi:hypothetical protein